MRQPRLSLGSHHVPWCSCDAEGSTFFLSLLTVMQMFLHVSCLAQTLSLSRHAIPSLACFPIIASASRQTPLQGFSAPPALPALLDSTLQGQGCAAKACQQLAQLWGGRQSRLLLQASFLYKGDSSPLMLHPPEQKTTTETPSWCPTPTNFWLLWGDKSQESPPVTAPAGVMS